MKKLLALALLLLAAPAVAEYSFAQGKWTLAYELSNPDGAELLDAYSAIYGYLESVPCVNEAVTIDQCTARDKAGVADGDCTAGQAGSPVTNPETMEQHVNRFVACEISNVVKGWIDEQAVKVTVIGQGSLTPIVLNDP